MCSNDLQQILKMVINVLNIIDFLVPIILIILCTIDLFKIIISKKEDDVKKLRNGIIMKIIYAIIIYLMPFIVSFILGAFDKILPMEYDSSWKDCWNYVKKNDVSFEK